MSNIESLNKKLTIIGGGYVGKAIAQRHSVIAIHSLEQKEKIVTITTTSEERVSELKEVADKVIVMRGDDLDAVKSLIENQDTLLLSLAPSSNVRVDAATYEQTYIPTVKNLQLALENNVTVKQIIYLGSGSVYGNQEGKQVDENTPVKIEDEYGKVLVNTEKILLEIARNDLKVCILRLGGIYGPKRELRKRFAKIAGTTLSGNGENFIAWIHLEDIVEAVNFVCQNRLTGIYNLVNDFNMTTKQILDRVCEEEGLEKVSWDTSKTGFSSLNARISNQKIKNAGYKLIHPKNII